MVNFKSENIPEDHEIFTEPGLSMGQRIMKHKFAKMNIWEFLGWKPKPKMTFQEAEDEILKNRLKLQDEIAEREAERERFRMECRKCTGWSMACSDLVLKFVKELPEQVFKDFYLQEGWTAYLPIEMGPLVKDTPMMYLMNSAVFDNPLIIKTFPLKY